MIFFHLDRAGTIQPGVSIELIPISQLPQDLRGSPFFNHLSEGLSKHGLNYMNLSCPLYPLEIMNGSIYFHNATVWDQLTVSDNRIMEYTFELVRRAHFPQYPSRLQSFFVLQSKEDFWAWPELLGNCQYPIYEIDAPDDIHCFDSTWLRGGLSRNIYSDRFFIAYAPTLCFDMAYKYWSKEASENPRWEYLIPLPIDGSKIRQSQHLQPVGPEDHSR